MSGDVRLEVDREWYAKTDGDLLYLRPFYSHRGHTEMGPHFTLTRDDLWSIGSLVMGTDELLTYYVHEIAYERLGGDVILQFYGGKCPVFDMWKEHANMVAMRLNQKKICARCQSCGTWTPHHLLTESPGVRNYCSKCYSAIVHLRLGGKY